MHCFAAIGLNWALVFLTVFPAGAADVVEQQKVNWETMNAQHREAIQTLREQIEMLESKYTELKKFDVEKVRRIVALPCCAAS